MNYEIQHYTTHAGWANCAHEDDAPLVFTSLTDARQALSDHYGDLRAANMPVDATQFCIFCLDDDKRVYRPLMREQLHRYELADAIEAADDMPQLAHQLQHNISTPELRELIDYLETLYEPLED